MPGIRVRECSSTFEGELILLANALPIEGWTHDPNDEALLQSLPVLDCLRFVNDVRRILGIRGFS
jgi:TFIIF-interacting CTD phosphatase-like protein